MAVPTLDGMPVELRLCILCNVPDFETLRSLVHASPVYHQVYVTAKRKILQGLVQRQLDPLINVEAITAVRSSSINAQTPSHTEMVIAFLDRRRRAEEIQHLTGRLAPYEPINLEETVELLRMQRIASFFLQDYCRNAPCPPWMDTIKWSTEILPIQLSDQEASRFLRAFYRMQIYCNLFGSREIRSEEYFPNHRSLTKPTISEAFSYDEVFDLFFATMPLWEVEESACVWVYFRIQWTKIFEEVAPYFSRDAPRFGGNMEPGSTPADCFEIYPGDSYYEEYCDHMISMGPSFLYKTLHQGTFERRCELIADNSSTRDSSFLWLLEMTNREFNSFFIFPANKYERDNIEDVLPLLPPLEQPNMAWIRFWHKDEPIDDIVPADFYDNRFGNPKGWEWGYVLWDQETLRDWQAPLLQEQ